MKYTLSLILLMLSISLVSSQVIQKSDTAQLKTDFDVLEQGLSQFFDSYLEAHNDENLIRVENHFDKSQKDFPYTRAYLKEQYRKNDYTYEMKKILVESENEDLLYLTVLQLVRDAEAKDLAEANIRMILQKTSLGYKIQSSKMLSANPLQ